MGIGFQLLDQKLEKPKRFILKTNYGGKLQRIEDIY